MKIKKTSCQVLKSSRCIKRRLLRLQVFLLAVRSWLTLTSISSKTLKVLWKSIMQRPISGPILPGWRAHRSQRGAIGQMLGQLSKIINLWLKVSLIKSIDSSVFVCQFSRRTKDWLRYVNKLNLTKENYNIFSLPFFKILNLFILLGFRDEILPKSNFLFQCHLVAPKLTSIASQAKVFFFQMTKIPRGRNHAKASLQLNKWWTVN